VTGKYFNPANPQRFLLRVVDLDTKPGKILFGGNWILDYCSFPFNIFIVSFLAKEALSRTESLW
jgi:hypothetical protein